MNIPMFSRESVEKNQSFCGSVKVTTAIASVCETEGVVAALVPAVGIVAAVVGNSSSYLTCKLFAVIPSLYVKGFIK